MFGPTPVQQFSSEHLRFPNRLSFLFDALVTGYAITLLLRSRSAQRPSRNARDIARRLGG